MKKSTLISRVAAVVIAGSVAVAVSGCAQNAAPADKSSDGTVKITVGSIPVAGDLPLLVAQKQGFFADHGLDVTIKPGANFAAILPLVQNGEIQVGFSSAVPLLNASSNGAPITAFATQEYTGDSDETATIAVMKPAGSTLSQPRDLEGHTVGVVAKGNSDSLALLSAVAKDGGDPSKVKLLELGIGAPLLQGLQQGNVDAIVGGEPTRTLALNAGGEVMFYPFVKGLPNVPQSAYFTSTTFAKASPEVLSKFAAAIAEATEYAKTHEAEVRKLLPEFLNIDAALADKVRLPLWETTFETDDWQKLVDAGAKLSMIDAAKVDLDKFLTKVK